jgi:hypothetical protein
MSTYPLVPATLNAPMDFRASSPGKDEWWAAMGERDERRADDNVAGVLGEPAILKMNEPKYDAYRLAASSTPLTYCPAIGFE